jgi:hypothetical protein
MNENSEEKKEGSSSLDQLLNKYVSIWIWTLLFGTLAGNIYSLFTYSYNPDRRWGELSILFIILMVLGLYAGLMAGYYLYRGLDRYIIPKFLLNKDQTENAILAFAITLRGAFMFLLISATMRLLMSLMELILINLGY